MRQGDYNNGQRDTPPGGQYSGQRDTPPGGQFMTVKQEPGTQYNRGDQYSQYVQQPPPPPNIEPKKEKEWTQQSDQYSNRYVKNRPIVSHVISK